MQPARAALTAHMDKTNALTAKRNALAEKARAATIEADAANKAAAEFARLQAELDTAELDARYTGTPVPNLKQLQEALAKAKLKSEGLASHGRAAQNAHRRFAFDMGEISRQQQEMQKAVPQLLHAALIESVGDYAEEFKAAETAFRTAHLRAFIAARAADQVAVMHQFPLLGAAALYAELNISRPHHAAFLTRLDPNTPGLTDEQRLAAGKALAEEQAQFGRGMQELDKAAEAYVNGLLGG